MKYGLVGACHFYIMCNAVSYTGIIIRARIIVLKGAIEVLYQSHSFYR